MIIDFHSHILPYVDDGSKSIEMTIKMLQIMNSQNIDYVIATPHFYPHEIGLAEFLSKREEVKNKVNLFDLPEIPHIEYGAEVGFFRGIGRCDRLDNLCIGQTNLILLEMPFRTWSLQELNELEMILDRGFIPVLAHLERYYSLQRDFSTLNDIIQLPVYAQINAEALISHRTRNLALHLLSDGKVQLLGSDSHDLKRRVPNLHDGRIIVKKRLGSTCLKKIDLLGEKLLSTCR